MPDLGLRFSSMNPEERAAFIHDAAGAIRNAQCVVLPTDTLYGLVTAADEAGVELLDEITGQPNTTDQPRMTLHIADQDQLVDHLVLEAATHRRLIERLLPGPARFIIQQPQHAIDNLCSALGVERGVFDNGSHIAVRVPDHPIFRQVLRSVGTPCVVRRLGSAVWAIGNNPGTDLSPIPQSFHEDSIEQSLHPAFILDDGETHHQRSSTTITLSLDGRIDVEQDGVLSEREILSHLERTILFVCTGNTCRSPMAHAIAEDLIKNQEPSGITTHIDSAGVAASQSMPMTNEAEEALASLGIDPGEHHSKQLTLPMIDQAEIIYTMTPSHAQAIMTMAPNSVHKVFVLDEHTGVPDPIGQSLEVYKHTAERLRELIAHRIKECSI